MIKGEIYRTDQRHINTYMSLDWPISSFVTMFNSFSAELFKVDSSMFKIVRLHFSCNHWVVWTILITKRRTMLISGETDRYELTHLNQYCLQKPQYCLWRWKFDWLIDWGLTPFLTISQLYHGGKFTYSCISWFSHTSTPHNNLP